MNGASTALPQVAAARVVEPGGPYERNALLAVAFVDPSVARLCRYDDAPKRDGARAQSIVPDVVSIELLGRAFPYAAGDVLTLSFVDPTLARIHAAAAPPRAAESGIVEIHRAPEPAVARPTAGVRLEWTIARVGRLLSLAEKLLAIDRLGWYRHSLALRLLLPDEIVLEDPAANDESARHLRALKMAATEALGTPLLAALMPNFTLDEEWLRSLETPALARAAAALRETLGPHVSDCAAELPPASHLSVGSVLRAELEGVAGTGIEVFLAAMIPTDAAAPELGAALREYRAALLELFGQTVAAPAAVRTTRLAVPNPVLDERLAALAREVDRLYGRLAVA